MSVFATGENAQRLLDSLDNSKLVVADFEDVRNAFGNSCFFYIGSGQAFGANMFERAAKQAMEDLAYYEAVQAMIIRLQCPSGSDQGEMEAELSKIICPAFPDAPILWCADLKDDYIDEIHIDVFAASNIEPELKVYKYALRPNARYQMSEGHDSTKIIGNDEDGIPDPTLYHFALEALGCQPEEFTEKKAATLEALTISSKMVDVDNDWVSEYRLDSLKGIAYFKNLMSLVIELNELKDISPLADLHSLCHFSINGPVQSIVPIREIHSLRILELWGCDFEDITPLENLIDLKSLTICSCGITDIMPIRKLTRLRRLNLFSNSIKDIRPLIGLTKLNYLALDANELEINVNTIDILRAIIYNNPDLKHLSFGNWD